MIGTRVKLSSISCYIKELRHSIHTNQEVLFYLLFIDWPRETER